MGVTRPGSRPRTAAGGRLPPRLGRALAKALAKALVPALALTLAGCGVPGSGVIDAGAPATGLAIPPTRPPSGGVAPWASRAPAPRTPMPRTPTTRPTTPPAHIRVFVYLLSADRLRPVARGLRAGGDPVAAAVDALLAGPTAAERAGPDRLGTRLTRPSGTVHVRVSGRTVLVDLPGRTPAPDALAMRQLTCTAALALGTATATAAPPRTPATGGEAATGTEVDVLASGHRLTGHTDGTCPRPAGLG